MNVRELMSSAPVTVRPATTVGETAQLMLRHHRSGLPVVDDNDRVVGVVTESDLVVKHANVHGPTYLGILGGIIPFETRRQDEEMRRALATTAADLMSTQFAHTQPDDSVDAAATLMVDGHAVMLPVIEQGRLVGTISQSDILRLLVVEETEDDGRAAG